MANRDTIREGDGPAMLSNWRLDLLDFWEKNHPKYLILAHLLLASMSCLQAGKTNVFIRSNII